MSRKSGPKQADHPSVGEKCPACKKPFKAGDYTTLVCLGPGDDEEARWQRDEGRPHNVVSLEIHWECSEQKED